MNIELNKSMMRRYFEEAWNQGRLEVLDEIVAVNYVNHDPFAPDLPPGPEGLRPIFIGLRSAFSDLHYAIEDMIAEGDKVVTRWTMRGTHTGELMGIPATHKLVIIGGVQIERFSNGKIVEHWRKSDDLKLLQQVGAIPTS